jgi:hypothetical protein
MRERDLKMRGAVYHLLCDARQRVAPQLSLAELYPFMLDYLFDCLILNPESGDFQHSGFEAAWDLAAWVKHAQHYERSAEFIVYVVGRIADAYVMADANTKNRIETGVVEHVLESPSLRQYFDSWKDHPQLGGAYERCLKWGKAHENGE